MPMPNDLTCGTTGAFDDIANDTLKRGLMANLEVMRLTGEKLTKEYQEKCASTLLQAGIALIPSDYLRDHQFVVSRGVYEAAKRLCEGK